MSFYLKFTNALFFVVCLAVFAPKIAGQTTNPVEEKVTNPITDTPNVNPVAPQQEVKPLKNQKNATPEGGDGNLVVDSNDQNILEDKDGTKIVQHIGAVDARYGIYRMQADKITVYEGQNRLVAEGNVIFDQGNDQRITGTKSEWNYRTKLGYFVNSTGFTNQTVDGTILYFTADRVEKISLQETVLTNAKVTACGDDNVPKWSFTQRRAVIKANDSLKMKYPAFRIKDVPVIVLPYASVSLKREDRKSGFLTPTGSYSQLKGVRISNAYFQTLGRSADITFRTDIYTSRGIGYGADLRTRANSRSYFNAGFFAVKDRILGAKESAATPNQGGTFVYVEGVHYFPNGFTASANVRLTSNLAFRQIFTDGLQQIISPLEVSQVFINKSWSNYTLNILSRGQTVSIPNVRVKTRNLPSINFEKRPSQLSFFKPAYFSFKTSLEGISRREEVDDINAYRLQTGSNPIITPAIGQRFDIHPQITVPFSSRYFNFTATAGARLTYYSDSLDNLRNVVGTDVIRKYGEFEFDVRPVALAKNFYSKTGAFNFRHTIEPYLTYRYITGVNNFNRIIRYDYEDIKTDTNEIEYGIINRIYTRRYTSAVSAEAQKQYRENPASVTSPLSVQPYELFTLTIRGKYYFDPNFGGALQPGFRNQIDSITGLTAFTFGGVPRRWSPINIDATYRPQQTFFINSRLDYGFQSDGVRAISATVGYDSPLVKVFQTFYYTRAVTLIPSLQQYSNAFGKEAGTLRGSQWSPSIFLGNRDRGWFGGTALFFDFQNRREQRASPLVTSTYTIGYTYDCCSLSMQYITFDLGVRRENRYVFSFRLNGIGAFGTEQFGQVLNR
jgi:LPS-assembly protein